MRALQDRRRAGALSGSAWCANSCNAGRAFGSVAATEARPGTVRLAAGAFCVSGRVGLAVRWADLDAGAGCSAGRTALVRSAAG